MASSRFFDMPLYQRLLLAIVQPIVGCLGAFLVIEFSDSDTAMGAVLVGSFALLVMAPLVSAPAHRWRRVLIIVLAALFIVLALTEAVSSLTDDSLLGVSEYVLVPAGYVLIAVLFGLVLVLAAPLKARLRYWLYLVLVGAVGGAGIIYVVDEMFCIFGGCPLWYMTAILIPLTWLSAGFVLATHFGCVKPGPGE